MKETYDKILNLFVGKDEMREWMEKPFMAMGRVCATDAYSIVLMPKEKASNPSVDMTQKVEAVYQFEDNCSEVITFAQFSEKMNSVPLIDDYDIKGEYKECEECNGSGEVDYVYEDSKGRDHEIEGECPICDGEGTIDYTIKVPNGKKIMDTDLACEIHGKTFKILQMKRVFEVMKLLGNKDLHILHCGGTQKSNMFSVDDVEIIVMPTVNTEPKDVCFRIN